MNHGKDQLYYISGISAFLALKNKTMRYFNLVEAGFVIKAEEYLYSSAMDYYGGRGLLDVIVLEGI